jgi:hypothetical protein
MTMSGPKRNPDALNTIGIVVVGICGAVLVYVTIVALEAFYVNDTSEIQTMADYGGQDTAARSLRTEQVNRIGEYGTNPKPAAPKANEAARPQSYRIPIGVAMKAVVQGAKADPSGLVPVVGKSDKSTVVPIFGRPKLTPAPAAAPAGGAPATPAAGTGSAAAAPAGAPPANATTLPSAPQVPTGAGTGPNPVGGTGSLDKAATPGTPDNPTGGRGPRRGATAAGTATTPPAPGTRPAGAAAGSNANADPRKPAAPVPPKGNDK